jgi:hypothetical protein
MKLVGSEEEENGITIVQLSQLMNCKEKKKGETKRALRFANIFPCHH